METNVKDFSTTLLSTLNSGAICLMISIGHRTGLFDTMSTLPPSTSEEIASASGLNERYVREWLNSLTVGEVIEFDAATRKYTLPAAHAAFLTRKNPGLNMAVFAQYVGVLGAVEDKIVDCFRQGGGVPYSAFTRFHEVMAEDSGQSLIPIVADKVIALVPNLRNTLENGAAVLDVGCGRGLALAQLAAAFPKSDFVGYDISNETVEFATKNANMHNLKNLRFEIQDAASFSDKEAFDFITAFDAIHDQAQPLTVLKNIHRALKSGGTFLMQDIDANSDVEGNYDHPIAPFLYAVSCMHCMTVSLSANGEGLGTVWGRRVAQEYLNRAGFKSVRIEKFEHDIQNCFYISTK